MTFFKQTIETVPIHDETVLLRVDYNVPLSDDGSVGDDFRIRASLPTLKKLLKSGCKVVIISHLGRPEGWDNKLSLEPVAQRLAELLDQPVRFVNQLVGDKVRMAVKRAPKQSVLMLENLRFDPGEDANDQAFAHELAICSGARYFVQDGFGVVHRAHASTVAITQYLPSVAGLLLKHEVTTIVNAMKSPERPLVAVLGGAKVSDKIKLIKAFIGVADRILIGGAMANTFLDYRGKAMGDSKLDPTAKPVLDSIYAAARKKVGSDSVDDFLVLPSDLAVARTLDDSQPRRTVSTDKVEQHDKAIDIGEQTIERFVTEVNKAKTVLWNGTLGMTELPEFAHGSARLALALATQPSITSIVGGGDTADFVLHWDAKKGGSFTHVSTGGGASLELMAGQQLPGVQSLLDA